MPSFLPNPRASSLGLPQATTPSVSPLAKPFPLYSLTLSANSSISYRGLWEQPTANLIGTPGPESGSWQLIWPGVLFELTAIPVT